MTKKISMVSLGIDLLLWIQFIAVLGYNVYLIEINSGRDVSFLIQILNYGVFANLLTVTMLGIESYGTSKKNSWAIIVSLVIRCHRIIMFVCFHLALPISIFRWAWYQNTSFLGTALYYNCFIIIGWDILKIILTATITLIIQRRKLPKKQNGNDMGSIIIREPSIIIDDSMY